MVSSQGQSYAHVRQPKLPQELRNIRRDQTSHICGRRRSSYAEKTAVRTGRWEGEGSGVKNGSSPDSPLDMGAKPMERPVAALDQCGVRKSPQVMRSSAGRLAVQRGFMSP